MTDRLAAAKLFATLFLFWLMLNGTLAAPVLGAGLVVAALIAAALPQSLSFLSGYRFKPLATLGFLLFFFKELIKANLSMAHIVLMPHMPLRPAFVRVRTRLTHPVGRLLLANAITLTPGTLSVEIEGDALIVHWVVAGETDPEHATRAIVAGFERYLEVIYG